MNNESEFNFETNFPPLGHPEHHFTKYPNHPWLKTEDEIYTWIDKYQDEYARNSIVVHKDLTVSSSELRFEVKKLKSIPVQFRNVDIFSVAGNKLTNLIGCPYIATEIDASNNKLISLLGLSSLMKGGLDLQDNKLKSFKGMCDNLESIEVICNPIESWEGFTNCRYDLYFWQDVWCERTSYNLLMETPENIKKLPIESSFISNKIKIIEDLGFNEIDMEWLRDEQKKYRSIMNIKKELESNSEKNIKENKRRKL